MPSVCVLSCPCCSLRVSCGRHGWQDVAINKRMAEFGAEVVPQGANILHHCNTGALATVDIGTAIGVIYGAPDSSCVCACAAPH